MEICTNASFWEEDDSGEGKRKNKGRPRKYTEKDKRELREKNWCIGHSVDAIKGFTEQRSEKWDVHEPR